MSRGNGVLVKLFNSLPSHLLRMKKHGIDVKTYIDIGCYFLTCRDFVAGAYIQVSELPMLDQKLNLSSCPW